ncbi:unnamed protein product [Caenorhabditis brenneri]
MKSHKVNTTTFDPLSYEEYLYGDPSEPKYHGDSHMFGDFVIAYTMEILDVINVILQIYDIACFIGFFINFIHLFILTRKELRGNLVYIVMTGICICDIIQSFGKFNQLIMEYNIIYKIEPCNGGLKHSHLMVNLLAKTAQIMCRRCSGFLVLYIAAFRTFSVMFPMSNMTQKLMNSKSGYFVVLLSGLVYMGWSLGYYFQTRFVKVLRCDVYEKRPSYVPYWLIKDEKWEIHYLFIDGVIALVTSGLSSNASVMIGFMALTVFISETTYGLFYLANLLVFQDYDEQKYFNMLKELVLTFLIFNSVTHVIICFLMSSQYRDTVKGLICRRKNETAAILELMRSNDKVLISFCSFKMSRLMRMVKWHIDRMQYVYHHPHTIIVLGSPKSDYGGSFIIQAVDEFKENPEIFRDKTSGLQYGLSKHHLMILEEYSTPVQVLKQVEQLSRLVFHNLIIDLCRTPPVVELNVAANFDLFKVCVYENTRNLLLSGNETSADYLEEYFSKVTDLNCAVVSTRVKPRLSIHSKLTTANYLYFKCSLYHAKAIPLHFNGHRAIFRMSMCDRRTFSDIIQRWLSNEGFQNLHALEMTAIRHPRFHFHED